MCVCVCVCVYEYVKRYPCVLAAGRELLLVRRVGNGMVFCLRGVERERERG